MLKTLESNQVAVAYETSWDTDLPPAIYRQIFIKTLPKSLKGNEIGNCTYWCQEVESNHWPFPYEGNALTNWAIKAYKAKIVNKFPYSWLKTYLINWLNLSEEYIGGILALTSAPSAPYAFSFKTTTVYKATYLSTIFCWQLQRDLNPQLRCDRPVF